MNRWPHFAPGSRVGAMALVLGVHALFVLLLLAANHMRARGPEPTRGLTGTWIRLEPFPPVAPAPAEETVVDESTPLAVVTPDRAQPAPRPLPPTAISLPQGADAPDGPDGDVVSRPRVDWYAEAARIAASAAQEKPTGIGTPLEPMREPCKPRVSSLWGKPKEPEPEKPPSWQDMVEPNAEVLTGVTRHTNKGGFSITLGKPKPRDDLFDDMLAEATPRSSVPHPEICD